MAKKTAANTAKSAVSEKKTILIIMVILLILANIIQAVILYDSVSRSAESATKQRAAEESEKKIKIDREGDRAKLLVARAKLGVTDGEEVTELENLKTTEKAKEKADKEIASWGKLYSALEETYKTTGDKAKTEAQNVNVIDALAFAEQKMNEAVKAKEVAEAATKDAEDKQKRAEDNAAKFKANEQAAIKAKEEGIKEVEKKKNDALEAANADIVRKKDEITGLNQKLTEVTENATKEIAKQKDRVKELETIKERLQAKVDATNVTAEETPARGEITLPARSNGTVSINKGSQDGFKVGMTFSVQASGTSARAAVNSPRKGAVEITEVTGPHGSFGKVIEQVNPVRDPIITGDLLFNPAFRPNVRNRVTICGIVDLNGDGRDDTPEFKKILENQGVTVDAYLDMKELTLRGNGPTTSTDFLIQGDSPTGQGGKLTEQDTKTIQKIGEVVSRAKELGVTVKPLRKFMDQTGLQVPPPSQGVSSGPFTRPTTKPAEPK